MELSKWPDSTVTHGASVAGGSPGHDPDSEGLKLLLQVGHVLLQRFLQRSIFENKFAPGVLLQFLLALFSS